MEREASVEERIRRAEEIYNRRNGITIDAKPKKKNKSIKRLIKQIFLCFIIYITFYIINNSSYIFSEEFLNRTKQIFTEDTNIYNIYMNIKNNLFKSLSTDNEEFVENNTGNQIESNNITTENQVTENLAENDENIGGAEENIQENEVIEENNETQLDKDVNYIKQNINFITPVEGKISSTFGWRTPTTKTVPKYHTGLDIAAETGTIIKSATEGTVILSSSEGDYGNHLKIQSGEIIVVYAHCNKLYVSQGDYIKQGQEIAEVGSTGNSTGPHLHLEIRREDRYIDPQLILNI